MKHNKHIVRQTPSLSKSQTRELMSLWNAEFPEQIRYKDRRELDAYLGKLVGKKHYIIENQGIMIAWICVFEREGETWFVILISKDNQGKGLGKALIEAAQNDYETLCGWVVIHNDYIKSDGSPYLSPKVFYQKLGFEFHDNNTLTRGGVTCTHISWRK